MSARWGLTELADEEAEIQRVAIERSARAVVLADGTKIGHVAAAVVGPVGLATTLVTDAAASPAEMARGPGLGVEVVDHGDGRVERRQAAAAAGGT